VSEFLSSNTPHPGNPSPKLFADVSKVMTSGILGFLLVSIGNLYLADLVGPATSGVFRYFQLMLVYTEFVNLGISHGLDKDGAHMYSRGAQDRHRRLVGASLAFSLIFSAVAALFLLVGVNFAPDEETIVVLLALILSIPVSHIVNHAGMMLTHQKEFGALSMALFLGNLFRTGLMILFALVLENKLIGVMIGFFLGQLVQLVYSLYHCGGGWPLSLRPSIIRKLLGVGAPITALMCGEMILATSDRFIVAMFIGWADNGLYNLALFAIPILQIVPNSFKPVLYTEVYETAARDGNLKAMRSSYFKSISIVSILLAGMAGGICYLVPYLIQNYMPEYRGSIFTLKVAVFLCIPLLLASLDQPILITHRQQRFLLSIQIVIVVFTSLVSILGIRNFGFTFTSVLIVHGTGWFVYFLLVKVRVFQIFGASYWEGLKVGLTWFLPAALVAGWIYLFRLLMLNVFHLQHHSLPYALTGALLHSIACIPMFYIWERRTGIATPIILNMLRRMGLNLATRD